ncbi:MucR family transcriptional regulator [Mycobacterium sp. KBS0706]|uniref:MucR family transcriptional regulator n=1 Tax=Mycobacterium sp. KBS0706 TaxID=2578109 RepID=UPI0027D2EEDC|nr:MucR family transcriptional regulator [Mycobacterium sp. KBS0706]
MSDDIAASVTRIVSAYVASNKVDPADLPGLVAGIRRALERLSNPPTAEPETPKPKPAVPISRSVTSDFIICLEDGLPLKMLKRHLATAYNLTPEAYRKRWGLPEDYPMVAQSVSAQRRAAAKRSGLGRHGAAVAARAREQL